MNRFLFVLGSNWQLSIAELDNCLRNSKFEGRIIDYSANIAIVEFKSLHQEKYYINKLEEFQFILGGCQKIAKIYDFIEIQTIYNAFPRYIEKYKQVEILRKKILKIIEKITNQIFPEIYKNIFFAISIYPNLYEDDYYSKILVKHFLPFLNDEITNIFKQKGISNISYYRYPEKYLKLGNLNPIFPHHVIKYELLKENRAELIFGFTEEGVYIARTFTVDNPNFKKKIDEERPFKDFKSSISPKLALMMLNFLNLFENREKCKILDPFVGNGVILLFALIQDFQIYGSDINNKKINNTKRNLYWLLELLNEPIPPFFNERFKKIDINNLSTQLKNEYFDGICTEPNLGPYYKKRPSFSEAKELIDVKLKRLYDTTFKESYKILKNKGRIVIIAPIINTLDGKDIQIDLEQIAKKYNFKLIPLIEKNRIISKSNIKLQLGKAQQKTLIDAKKGQIIKRKIYIFEKQGE
ncbi:MAG: TRM11 family SAM-dependent methyltransferase [Promethearchaeota archaeon]